MSEPVYINRNTKWIHRKTKRPAIVTHGNRIPETVMCGTFFPATVGDNVTFKYTDRTTRVMPVTYKLDKFLKTFEAA